MIVRARLLRLSYRQRCAGRYHPFKLLYCLLDFVSYMQRTGSYSFRYLARAVSVPEMKAGYQLTLFRKKCDRFGDFIQSLPFCAAAEIALHIWFFTQKRLQVVYFSHFPVYLICRFLNLFQELPTEIKANKPVGMREAFNLISVCPDFQVTFVQDAAYQELVIDQTSTNVEQAVIGAFVKIIKCSLITVAEKQQVLLVACGRLGEFMKCHSIYDNLGNKRK